MAQINFSIEESMIRESFLGNEGQNILAEIVKQVLNEQINFSIEESMIRESFLGNEGQNILAEIVKQVLNEMLLSKAEDMCKAKPYEQTLDRIDYRNGTRERSLLTRIGEITLSVPRLRNQSLTDEVFARYKRSEQSLMLGIAEMVIKGVSTRKISNVSEALFGASISKSQVSRMCKILDPQLKEFREKPLDEYIPFVIIDAIYLKIREDFKVVSKALYIALGINKKGFREVLGLMIADSETKEGYSEFFNSLKERGLKKVDLVVSDNHSGLREAIKETFVGASWQRCQTHFSRNMLDKCPKKLWSEIKEILREIYTAPDIATARTRKNKVVEKLLIDAPKAANLLDESFEDITAVFAIPLKYRKKLRTSNSIERTNEEIRRREKVIRIFPNEDSAIRIIGTILLEQHEDWMSNKYFDMEEYFEFIKGGGENETDFAKGGDAIETDFTEDSNENETNFVKECGESETDFTEDSNENETNFVKECGESENAKNTSDVLESIT